jgi:hypothetical protein
MRERYSRENPVGLGVSTNRREILKRTQRLISFEEI